MMVLFVGMIFGLLTILTLTLIDNEQLLKR
jgi:hypothetical protein